jgi:hypothetical protein
MNKIINSLSLIASAAEYFDRSTSAGWRIRAALTNMAVWSANSTLYTLGNNPDSDQAMRAKIKMSTIRTWLRDCNNSSFTLDLTNGNVRKTLGLERITDPHEDACRVARTKCVQTRSAAGFKKYYEAAISAAIARREERERNVSEIADMLSDSGWVLHGQCFDSRGYDVIYDTPTFVADEDLSDEDLLENEIDKLSEVIGNALESMWSECEAQLSAAIISSKITRLSAYKVAIEQMMDIIGVDKVALAKRQITLESQIKEQAEIAKRQLGSIDAEIEAQMAEITTPQVAAIEPAKPLILSAAERRQRREARMAAAACKQEDEVTAKRSEAAKKAAATRKANAASKLAI